MSGGGRRAERRAERQRRRTTKRLYWGIAAVAVIIPIGVVIWLTSRSSVSDEAYRQFWKDFPEQSRDHVEVGQPHDPYSTNPPTSGPHAEQPNPAGFYEEVIADEYLVHSMEHGYVIIWYNCTILTDAECSELKANIQKLMDEFANYKLIGTPRNNMEHVIALTVWTRLDEFDEWDADRVRSFIRVNRNALAPEPNAE